jgi:hypothetical protein
MSRVDLLLLGRIKKIMTKFQFHVILTVGFLHLAQGATGFTNLVFWFLVYLFAMFSFYDIYKEEQAKYFNT